MKNRIGSAIVAVLAAVLATTTFGSGPAAAQAASGSFVTTIYSPWANTCVDVPGGTTDINTKLIGAACSSSAEQQFTFVPETDPNNGLAGYSLFNHASGLCAVKFRFEVRQNDCAHANPVPGAWIWRLIPVDPAAQKYLLEPTYVGATAQGRCMQGGTATSVYTPFCNTGDASQVLVLAGMAGQA